MSHLENVNEVVNLLKSKFSLENEMYVTKHALEECKNESGKHLDLKKLLETGNMGTRTSLVDFAHDIAGVVGNINWDTGHLENGFVPLCGYEA